MPGLIRITEDSLRFLVEQSAHGILLLDAKAKLLYASQATQNITGYSQDELLGRDGFDFVHPDDVAQLRKVWEECLSRPDYVIQASYRLHHKDGGWRHVEATGTNRLAEPSLRAVVLNIRDVSDRKRAEEALRHSEERYRALVDISPEAIFVQQGHHIVFANPSCIKLLGASTPEQIIGRSIFDIIHPADHEIVKRRIAEDLAKGRTVPPLAETWVRLDGNHVDVEVVATPFTWNGAWAVQVVARDITERKQQEEERGKLLAILDQSPDLVGLADADGTVLYVNRTGRRMIGLEGDKAAAGRNMCEFIAPSESLEARQAVVSAMRAGKVVQREIPVTHFGGGAPVLLEVRAFGIFDRDRKLIGYANVSRDVSDRNRAEEALRQSESRYRSLFDNMLNGFAYIQIVFDGERPVDFVYLAVNRAFETLTGLRDVVGKRATEVIPGIRETDPELLETYGRVARTGVAERFEAWVEALKDWYSISAYSTGPDHVVAVFDVITERKRGEERVRDSAERYRSLVLATAQVVWTTNEKGEVAGDQPMWCAFTGQSTAEIQGRGWIRSLHPDDQKRTAEIWTKAVASRAPYDTEYRLRRHDGEFRYVAVRGVPVLNSDGSIREWVGTCTDVTDRYHAEEALRLQAAALASAANAIVITDIKGNIQWVNPAFERLTGYASAEVIGMTPRVLRSGAHEGAFYREMWETILAGRVWQGDLTNRRKDGTLYTEHQTITPVRDAGGAVTNFVAIKQDITDRKRAEEDLLKSEAEHRSIVESAPYGIYRVTESGDILMANPAFVRMLGYDSEAEVLSLNTARDVYVDPQERLRGLAHWADKLSVTDFESEWKRKDGKRIRVRLGARRLPQEGDKGPQLLEVFAEDVSERRLLEEQFRQAQKMEAVGRLAGGVAHDFNNLLMIMGSCAQLLAEAKGNPAKIGKYTGQIRDAVNKAAALTRQLLAFSRQQVLEPTVLSLNSVVTELGKMLPRLLGEDVEMVFALDRKLGNVNADRGQLEQVIMNLAVNARDAMPKGGKLTIETANVELDGGYTRQHGVEVPPGPYVLLAITDTGTGMDQETQARIFEPFFTTKERGKGTGLGLATVYGIVKQSGGYIWVYSELGHGTTFKIYLPLVRKAAPTVAAGVPPKSMTRGSETILLVEDEAALREVTSEYLKSMGYTVLEAGSGAEALETCRSHRGSVHALITDMVMPGMTGLELAKAVREIHVGLPVIYMSGYTDRTIDREVLGPDALFLQKPLSLTSLGEKLRAVLSRRSLRPEGAA